MSVLARNTNDSDMRDEYDFSKATHGKRPRTHAKGSRAVVLDPDVAQVFTSAYAVNKILRTHLPGQVHAHVPDVSHMVSDEDIIDNLREFLAEFDVVGATRRSYGLWPNRVVAAATVENRFGTWGRAIALARGANPHYR